MILTAKEQFLVILDRSDNKLLCQLCKKCNESVWYTGSKFI